MASNRALLLAGVLVMVATLMACNPGGEGTGIRVNRLPTITIENGVETETNVVGKKRISIEVDPQGNRLLPNGEGVQVTFRFPDSAERTERATLKPGTTNVYAFEVPGSEALRLCEKMLFRWTVIYESRETGTRGTFVGQEETLRPTSEREGSQIRQALCAD